MSPSPVQPPVSPSIAAQQVPLAQYAQQSQGPGPGPGNGDDQQQTSMGLVQSLLMDVGNTLEKVAKVIVIQAPELIPILKAGVRAIGMLNDEVTKAINPNNGAPTQETPMPGAGAVSAGQ